MPDHWEATLEVRLWDRICDKSVQRVMEAAKPCFSFYPFAEGIPQRFR